MGSWGGARPLFYPWDNSHSGKPLSQMTLDELEAHLVVLRARKAELEQLDTRLRPNARQLERDARDELRALAFALQNTEHEIEDRRARGY